MHIGITRAQLLRGNWSGKSPVRPPWAVPESGFVAACDRCDACVRVCPSRIIGRGAGGFPEIDFERGECTFCAACVHACHRGALKADKSAPWRLAAVADNRCLSVRGTVCRVCADACDARAITFAPALRGASQPEISGSDCNGCGACYRVCPVSAIRIEHRTDYG